MASSVLRTRALPSSQPSSNLSLIQLTWSCSKCTRSNANPITSLICNVCQSPRIVPDPPDPDIEIIKEIGHFALMNIGARHNSSKSQQTKAVVVEEKEEWKRPPTKETNRIRKAFGVLVDNSLRSKGAAVVEDEQQQQTNTLTKDMITPTDALWGCLACTYQSPMTSTSCDVCGQNKPSVASTRRREELNRRKSNDPRGPIKNSIVETFSTIIEECEWAHAPFVDDCFPPAPKSLYFNGVKTSTGKRKYDDQSGQVTADKWLRPSEIKDPSIKINSRLKWAVTRKPVPSDICQGSLGNCWFIGALTLIAEREELLDNILKTKTIQPAGAYIVRLCKDGKWTDVIVDDLFPCDSSNRLIYSKGKRMQLWVPLIEKAMAKLHGCYEALVSGHVNEGLMTLTGFPCERLMLLNKEDVDMDLTWMKLLSYHAAGYLLGVASGGLTNVTYEEYKEKGLVPNHVYSMLNIVDASGHKLIQLRNPWGHFSWNGDWSDNSKCWEPKLKKELKPKRASEGVFWISFKDFIKYFYVVDVCKIRKDWDYTSFQGIFLPYCDAEHTPIYKIKISQTTELDITLYQNSGRETKKLNNELVLPGDLRLMLFKAAEGVISKEDCIRKATLIKYTPREKKRMIPMNCILDPGIYYLIPLSLGHWTDDDFSATYPGFEISIYSSRRMSSSLFTCPPNNYLLADCIIGLLLSQGFSRKSGNTDVAMYSNSVFDIGSTFMLENLRSDKWVTVQLDLRQSTNLYPTRGSLLTIDCIPPRSRLVANVLTMQDPKKGGSAACLLKWIFTSTPNISVYGGCSNSRHEPNLTPKIAGLHSPRPI